MVFALLIAAILWNLGTWWLGLPASSSHTMVGSIIGVGLANQLLMPHTGTSGVDWEQCLKVLKVLLISPVVGFVFAGMLILLAKQVAKYPELYEAPKDNTPPPLPDSRSHDLYLHLRQFLPWIKRWPEGHGPHHAHPYRHRSNRIRAQSCREPCTGAELCGRVSACRANSRAHAQPTNVGSTDARQTVTEYIRTKQLQPNTILALRKLIDDTTHEVALYKQYKSVLPRSRPTFATICTWPVKRSGS